MPLADIRRERIALPLLRDERPELQVRELTRIVAERAGLAPDSTADDGAEPGLDVAPGDPVREPIGFRAAATAAPMTGRAAAIAGRTPALRAARRARDRHRTSPAGSSASSSAASSARPGFERAVLGLSGGIDSALVAYLVAEAIGAERLLCVLMPYRTSSDGVADRRRGGRRAGSGAASELVDISPMVDALLRAREPDATPLRRGNFMARQRMAVLYDRSVTWGGLVVGTGNKTESLIGYTTLFGDNACAFNPIGDLYKSQVRQLAAAIGVPDAIIRKAPSADLWPGQTDETEAGFSYPVLDRLLFWRIDNGAGRRGDGGAGLRSARSSSGSTG